MNLSAKKVLWVRKQLGLTQKEFADKLGVSRGYIGDIEAGRTAPSKRVLFEIVMVTGLPIEWLESDKDTQPFEDAANELKRLRGGLDPKELVDQLGRLDVKLGPEEYLKYESGSYDPPLELKRALRLIHGTDADAEVGSHLDNVLKVMAPHLSKQEREGHGLPDPVEVLFERAVSIMVDEEGDARREKLEENRKRLLIKYITDLLLTKAEDFLEIFWNDLPHFRKIPTSSAEK
jgi:transcriptional regulator with XRE-family HTH domain